MIYITARSFVQRNLKIKKINWFNYRPYQGNTRERFSHDFKYRSGRRIRLASSWANPYNVRMNLCLVLGARGRVGSYLVRMLEENDIPFIAWGRADCDMYNPEAAGELVANSPAGTVINCAAVSGIEECLDDPVSAHYINAMSPQHIARACARQGKKFIHLSTDYVLDGTRPGLKNESSICKPANTYGESKWEAEMRIADEMPDALIARVSWVFGNMTRPSFPEMVLKRAMEGSPLSIIGDKDSMPTFVDDLCQWLITLTQGDTPQGILHLCQSGTPVTWADYARETILAADEAGLPLRSKEVTETRLDDQAGFRETRPRHTAMDSGRLASLLGHPVRSWQDTLRQYIRTYAQNL